MSFPDGNKKIKILYTGGTMGMKKGADGALSPVAGYLTHEIHTNFVEGHADDMPTLSIKEYEPLIDSSCMGVEHWVRIATDISTYYDDYDGFVVLMGTDTMAYASTALSFMLENLTKPVIFTGSQVPFCEVYSDARRNLVGALLFAARDTFNEVCVFFNDKLMRANRCVKVNSVSLSAFDSPNYPPLATVGAFIEERKELALQYTCYQVQRNAKKDSPPLVVHKDLDAKILVIRLVPGFDDDSIMCLVRNSKNLRALVFEMYGTGNGPSGKELLIDAIKEARSKGIICVGISQCLHGGVSLETYSMGLEFKNAGIISGGDMTCEAVSTKLAYLFGTVTPDTAYNILDSVRGGEAQITSPPASIRDSVTPTKHAARSPNPENPECQQIPGPRQAESETDQTVNSMFSNAANFIRLDVTPPPVELRELHKTTSGTLEAKGTIDLENITRLIEYLLQRNLRGEISDSAMSNSMKNMFSDLGHSFPNMDHIDH